MVGGPPIRTAGGTNARRALAATVAVAVALAATAAGTAVVGAQSDGPVLAVGDATVDPGETAQVAVTLDEAPKGVSGFAVNVSVADPSVATLTNVSLGEGFESPGGTTGITDDGSTVYMEAADLGQNVESGATDVTLATLTVRGEADGETALEASVTGVDNDNGNATEPVVENGNLTVGDEQTQTPTETTEPSTTTDGSGPGFTVAGALAALVAAGLVAKRAA